MLVWKRVDRPSNVVSTSYVAQEKDKIVNIVRPKRKRKEFICIYHIFREDNLKNCMPIYVWPQDFIKQILEGSKQ